MSVDTHSVLGSDEPPSLSYRQKRTELYNDQYRSTRIQHQVRSNTVQLSEKESSSQFPLATISRLASQNSSLNSPSDNSYLAATPAVDDLFNGTQEQVRRALADQISPLRLAGHLSVLVVAAVIFAFTQIDLSEFDLASLDGVSGVEANSASSLSAINTVDQLLGSSNDAALVPVDSEPSFLQRAIRPFTTILPDAPSKSLNRVAVISDKIEFYTVQPGDTVLGIANKYGLKPETLQDANDRIKQNPDLLSIGDTLRIMPVDGAIHRVQSGDTLSTIAVGYNVNIDAIVGYGANNLSSLSAPLSIGNELIIPGGVKAYVPPQALSYTAVDSSASIALGEFGWPTSGNVTQGYWSGHRALDIGSWTGAPVKSSDGGRVMIAKSGWNYGYGNYVVVDHGNGFVSLYGHLNSIYVQAGENVSAGQKIGTVGNTGNSTGPHLHFEIRYKDGLRNPNSYLH